MINAFPKSRCVAWTGGAVLGAAAGISAWLYMAGRAASLFNRAIVALLAAFIAVNIALYIARLMAAREYQKRLLLLYEALDPSAFLQALLPLRKKRMDASNRCTTLVHIANGYLYGGQPQQALAVLEDVQPPEKALEIADRSIAHSIRETVEGTPSLRERYRQACELQKKIDECKAAGRKIPAAWISNPFHLKYYGDAGRLE